MESKVTVHTAPLSIEESTALNKFKDLLKSKKVEYNPNQFDDGYLVRFLRARKLDLNKSFEMFTNFLKWRIANNVDEIEKFQIPEVNKIKVCYPHGFHKTDKLGRPIYIEIIGELKIDELFKVTTSERLSMYQVKLYERLLKKIFPVCSTNANKHISQTFTIIDLKKMTGKLLSKKAYNFLKLTSMNSQNYYPEILGQLYVVNAGILFKAAWSVCKAFVDEKTKKKITTLGSDYKKKLLEHVDAANLPHFLGGECKCEPYGCIFSNAGPWNTGDTVEVSPELIQAQLKMTSNSEETTEEAEAPVNVEEDLDGDEKEKLEELSKQLNENMDLAKGHKENAKFKMENQVVEGETPINTQEVKSMFNSYFLGR